MWVYRRHQYWRARESQAIGGPQAPSEKAIWVWLDQFSRQALLIAAVVALVLGVGWIVRLLLFTPPVYEAEARILASNRTSLVSEPDGQTDSRSHIDEAIAFLRSPFLLLRVIDDPDIGRLSGDPGQTIDLDYLCREVTIHFIENSDLLAIRCRRAEPKEAAAIVKAVLDAYMKTVTDREAWNSQIVVDLWVRECDQVARELELEQQRIRLLQKKLLAGESAARDAEPRQPNGPWELQSATVWLEQEVARLMARRAEWEALRSEFQTADPLDETQLNSEELAALDTDRAYFQPELEVLLAAQASAKTPETLDHLEYRIKWWQGEANRRARELLIQRRQLKVGLSTWQIDRLDKSIMHVQYHLDRIRRMAIAWASLEELQLSVLLEELRETEEYFKMIADRSESLNVELRSPIRVADMRRAAIPTLPL